MLIMKGRHRGKTVPVSQWANNWISAKDLPGQESVLSPMMVRLDPDEIVLFRKSIGNPKIGYFWQAFQLLDTGDFIDLRPVPAPRRVRHSAHEVEQANEIKHQEGLSVAHIAAQPCLCQPVNRICQRCRILGEQFGRKAVES